MRLQKFLAECGVASRRGAEELILQGRVSVSGMVVTQMGVQVEEGDLVEVDGKRVLAPKKSSISCCISRKAWCAPCPTRKDARPCAPCCPRCASASTPLAAWITTRRAFCC